MSLVNLLHIVFVAPLLWYIGTNYRTLDKRWFDGLMWLGVIVGVFHLWRLMTKGGISMTPAGIMSMATQPQKLIDSDISGDERDFMKHIV